MTTGSAGPYAARLSVDCPDRDLDKFSTLLRLFYLIPIAVVLVAIEGGADNNGYGFVVGAGGILFAPTLLMILFREKYPAGGSISICNWCAFLPESSPIWV